MSPPRVRIAVSGKFRSMSGLENPMEGCTGSVEGIKGLCEVPIGFEAWKRSEARDAEQLSLPHTFGIEAVARKTRGQILPLAS